MNGIESFFTGMPQVDGPNGSWKPNPGYGGAVGLRSVRPAQPPPGMGGSVGLRSIPNAPKGMAGSVGKQFAPTMARSDQNHQRNMMGVQDAQRRQLGGVAAPPPGGPGMNAVQQARSQMQAPQGYSPNQAALMGYMQGSGPQGR